MKSSLGLASVLKAATNCHPKGLSPHQWKVINTIIACRTPVLGGHRYHCDHCHTNHFVPRSCGNRHCPVCQRSQALEWLENQKSRLLPVPYFHVIFTLPHELNGLIAQNRKQLYTLLFKAASETLLDFGRNNHGVLLGITAVLHTWSQTLGDHYHLHCLVTGGGPAIDGSALWKTVGQKYLFPVKALGKVFRSKYLAGLRRLHKSEALKFYGNLAELTRAAEMEKRIGKACSHSWNVYAKPPFSGPSKVLEYFSRYTHRVAITPSRLQELNTLKGKVQFVYKVRSDPPKKRIMELNLLEFIRRFALHILPPRFMKIRHYGLLSNRDRNQRLETLRRGLQRAMLLANGIIIATEQVSLEQAEVEVEVFSGPICPNCGQGRLRYIESGLSEPIRGSPE